MLNWGIWTALSAVLGMGTGLAAMRFLLPHVPLFSGLVMEPVDESQITEAEKLADYSTTGTGGCDDNTAASCCKIKIDNQLVQVVSDGSVVKSGQTVRVIEVNGTRVVVEAVEDT